MSAEQLENRRMERMRMETKKKRGVPVNRSRLMEAIGQKNMSMEALAKEADVDQSTIYHLLKGENGSPEILKNLSGCLGVPMEELVMNPGDALKVKRKIVKDYVGQAGQDDVETFWSLVKKK